MSTVGEIEEAIKQLPPEEAHQLWDWFLDYFEDELTVRTDFQEEIAQGRREIAEGDCRSYRPDTE
jgi:hypothetical protein